MPSYEHAVRDYLTEAGCEFVRKGKGDHEIWRSPISGRHFTVDGKIKSRHTANEVMKQAGIGKKFWSKLSPSLAPRILPRFDKSPAIDDKSRNPDGPCQRAANLRMGNRSTQLE